METNKTKTKSDLLRELESIKGLLLDDHDIPVLQEIIEHDTSLNAGKVTNNSRKSDISAFSQTELTALKETYEALLSDAEQLSHFAEDNGSESNKPQAPVNNKPAARPQSDKTQAAPTTKAQAYTPPQARGENPFLPQHIRARLRGNRMDFSLPEVTAEQSPKTRIINEIIRDILPELEKQLRQHLLNLTDDALQKLVQNDSDHT